MTDINNDKSLSTIKKKEVNYFEDIKNIFFHFGISSIITIIITIVYYNFFNSLSSNEIVSLNSDASFPFMNLKIKINYNNRVRVTIAYGNKNSQINKKKQIINKYYIDIKKELNLGNLIIEDEDNDYLSIAFFLSGENNTYGNIELENEIYMIENNFEVKKQIRTKKFNIKEEAYFSSDKKEPRVYRYYIRSHSIKTPDDIYNFSVIDDNYNIRPIPMIYKNAITKDFIFGVSLRKKKFLNRVEIFGESWQVIFWNSLGTVTAIIDFIIPLLIWLFNRRRFRNRNNLMHQNLTQNESTPQNNNNFEMDDRNENIYKN